MRRMGYAQVIDPDRPLLERDTISCGHCGKVIFIKPGTVATVYLIQQPNGLVTEEPGAGCHCCDKPVCLVCHDRGTCRPLERWLEQKERLQPTR